MSGAYDLAGKRVWVAGHRGMVGSALVRRLKREHCEILTVGREDLDLRRQSDVEQWVTTQRPQAVFLTAARVGGIHANATYPADFIFDNLAIATNIIQASHAAGVETLMFLGSSCIYPRLCSQPMREAAILTGPLEPTNEPYAIAKLAGISLCRSYNLQHGARFISVIPTNLYGPGDNLDPAVSHVVPAMVRKALAAKLSGDPVEIWGSGSPRREFLYVDDAADAFVFLMRNYDQSDVINVGAGETLSVRGLAEKVSEILDCRSGFRFDLSKPDGMPVKVLDSSGLLAMGWRPMTSLDDGLAATCDWVSGKLQEGTN